MGRFEYRYFNGVQWTSDVAVNGQRYVDSPIDQIPSRFDAVRPSRAMAIASFITALGAIALGWVPFVFVVAAGAALAAIVFGLLGLKVARLHGGYGRRFAVAGLLLSPVALAVCVGGFLFTKAVLREFRDFIEPGPHQLVVQQPCTLDNGTATLHGTIRNTDDESHDYRIVIDFTSSTDESETTTVRVRDVDADATASWTGSVAIGGTAVQCKVTDVFGPLPFDVDNQS
jgi:hypothetical protein